MEYEKVESKFGKWAKYFRKFIESEDMNALFRYIKQRSTQGAKILPASANVFRVFLETDPDNLRVIICGIAPYHTTYGKGKDQVVIADGLALSCSSTYKQKGLQPSLEQIYTSWENDYNDTIDVDMIQDGDLMYLAKQGVLLYNVALTVEENKPLSMNPAWEKFNRYFWEEVINKYFRGIPCLFLGQQSHKSANYLTPMLHYPILVSHPASASYQSGIWKSEGCWKKIDDILWQNNKIKIQWYRRKGQEIPEETKLPSFVTESIYTKEELERLQNMDKLPWEE